MHVQGKTASVPTKASESDRSNQQQRWIQSIQEQVDAATASALLPHSDVRGAAVGSSPGSLPPGLAGVAAASRQPAATSSNVSSVASLQPSSASPSSLGRSRANGSSGSMIPLAVAQEAAERQQQWLNQLQRELDAPNLARQVGALESDDTQ